MVKKNLVREDSLDTQFDLLCFILNFIFYYFITYIIKILRWFRYELTL